MWDIEVDVACIGAGISSMAGAIATADAGGKVLVATPPADRGGSATGLAVQQCVGGFLRSWGRPDLDVETREYLTAVGEDLVPSERPEDARLTVRTVSAMANSGAVEPFVGSRLRAWNAQCLASPYGMLFSSVSGWRAMQQMRTSDGQSLDVQAIGAINPAELGGGRGLSAWMVDRVHERGIAVHEASRLDRIVFDDGRIVGVVLSTSDGPLAVGVHRGVVISSSDPFAADSDALVAPSGSDELQVCIVGQPASRFLRIELLKTERAKSPVRPTCTASGRQLRQAMRDARSLPSGSWSRGKLR
jgi:phytoene dehydrogenase-like protein